MFDWVKSVWGRITSKFRTKKLGQFNPDERMIFTYFNGEKIIQADPMILYKRVMEVGPVLSIDIKVAFSPSKDAETARVSAIEKIRNIFNLKPLSQGIEVESTLSDSECGELLEVFLNFCDAVKKNSKVTPNSVTEVLPSIELSSIENPTTQNTLDSGSTDTDQKQEQPGPLPKELPSHLDSLTQD